MNTNELIKMGIGENVLEKKNLARTRVDVLETILEDIDKIKQDNNQTTETKDYNNFVSILGGRGSGKSSMILTVLNDLKKQNNEFKNNPTSCKTEIEYDFILKKIDPLMFNLEKNALGWIIYSFADKVNKIKNMKNKDFCDELSIKIEDLEKKHGILTKNYIISRDFYRNNLASLSEGRMEYKNVNEEIIRADLELENAFKKFINSYIEIIKIIYKDKEIKKEPYIIISFDDIDIRPQYGPEILDTIIKYLKHKNIIVIISGDYDTFKESLFIDLWRKQNPPENMNINEVLIEEPLKNQLLERTDQILNKVMPPAYMYELEPLTLFERLTYTPYGAEGDSIAKILSSLKIIKYYNNGERVKKEAEHEESLLDYFIKPLIDASDIKDEIDKIENSTRVYNGLKYDKNFYINNNKAIKSYENLNRLYSVNKSDESFTKKVEEIETYCSVSIKLVNVENSSENDLEKILLKNIKLGNTCRILPNTPRGLINLYHKLVKEFKKEEKEKKEKIFIKKWSERPSFGQGDIRNFHSHNFDNIAKLLNMFQECNIELKYNDEKKAINKFISYDYDNSIINLDFEFLEFKSNEFFYNKVINITESFNLYRKNEEDIYIKQRESLASFIELAYDLAKSYLIDTNVNIRADKKISDITIYNRNDDEIKVKSENFDTFREFYVFQSMYKILIPLIIKDLKVHRNIRDRLRLHLYNMILSIIDKKNDKSVIYKYNYEVKKLSEIISKTKDDKKNEYLEKASEYFHKTIVKPEKLDGQVNYNISDFILYFKENNGYVFKVYKDIVNEDEKLVFYNNICLNLTSTKTYVTRFKDLVDIIKDYKRPLKYFDMKDNLCNVIDTINNLISEKKKTEKEIIDEHWNIIVKEIIKVAAILVGNIMVNINLNDEKETVNTIDELWEKQRYKEIPVTLLNEFKDFIKRANLKVKGRDKAKVEIHGLYEELSGVEFEKIPDNINISRIEEFLSKYDYWTEKSQKYVELLQQLNEEKTPTKAQFKKYIDSDIIPEIEDNDEKKRFEIVKAEILKLEPKKDKDEIEKLIKDFIETVNNKGL